MKNLLILSLVLMLYMVSSYSYAQDGELENDTILKIVVNGKTARIKSDLKIENTTIKIDDLNADHILVVELDNLQNIKIEFREGGKDDIIATIDFKSDTLSLSKRLKGLFNDCKPCSKIAVSFNDENYKFQINEKEIGAIFIENTSATPEVSADCDSNFSFIPELYFKSKGGWPDFVSNDNIKYRFAIDFSESFSQASVWKLKKKWEKWKRIDYYKRKKIIRPKHLRFMSLSVRNYYPRCDSIVTKTEFDSYNTEGRSIFEKYEKQVITKMGVDSTEKKEGKSPESASNEEPKKSNTELLLRKLNSDLAEYSKYLNRNIIDKSFWLNDVHFINSQLNKCFGLKDYTVNGLLLKLNKNLKENNFDERNKITHSILVSYASILTYNICY